jgi:tryptophanyl-tRNA synthetase
MPIKTIITGLQPSGDLHIGNYVGALQQILEFQSKFDCFLFVADLHAMTVPYEAKVLRQRVRDVVRMFLAVGVNPEKCLIFVQSQVPQHAELAWILGTQLPIAELERMTQYKEKSDQKKAVSVGLFNYPVLMAADILLYQVDAVPVGQDQVQHVELSRTLARKFNNQFGNTFKLPEVLLKKEGARILGTDGKSKMSKSLGNTIGLLDSPEDVRKKVRKAVVHPPRPESFEGKRPITIFEWHDQQFASASTRTLSQQCHVENRNCEAYKELVAKNISGLLAPIQKKYQDIVNRGDDWLLRYLNASAEVARARAERTMEMVRARAGLR